MKRTKPKRQTDVELKPLQYYLDTLKFLQSICEKRFGLAIGEGRNRIVFKHKGFVVKIPRNIDGDLDNECEADIATTHSSKRYARCRIRRITINDIPISILIMEFINTEIDALPPWAIHVDCQQVGTDKHGNFKIYDFGKH